MAVLVLRKVSQTEEVVDDQRQQTSGAEEVFRFFDQFPQLSSGESTM